MLLWSKQTHHWSKKSADEDYRDSKCNIAGIEEGIRRGGLPFFVVVHVVIPVAPVLVCADRTEGSKDEQARVATRPLYQVSGSLGSTLSGCSGSIRSRSSR